MNDGIFEVDAVCEKALSFVLYNNPQKQKIEITKTDIETGEALAGAEYEILDSCGKQIFKGKTGGDGNGKSRTYHLESINIMSFCAKWIYDR